jgi:hypothetical protein
VLTLHLHPILLIHQSKSRVRAEEDNVLLESGVLSKYRRQQNPAGSVDLTAMRPRQVAHLELDRVWAEPWQCSELVQQLLPLPLGIEIQAPLSKDRVRGDHQSRVAEQDVAELSRDADPALSVDRVVKPPEKHLKVPPANGLTPLFPTSSHISPRGV